MVFQIIGGCSENWIVNYILTNHLMSFIRRIVPALQAMWVQVDVFLDARQTWTYYDHAYTNGTYNKWAKDHMLITNSSNEKSVSEGYFMTAMVIWFFTPTLFAIFWLYFIWEPLVIFNSFFNAKHDFGCTNNFCLKAVLAILLFPIEIVSAAFIIYVMIPYSSFKQAYKILMRHEFRIDEPLVRSGAFPIESKFLPFWKGFEFIGEAFPQLVLAIVFVVNNHDFMNATTTVLVGLKEFEATLISIIFSFGSIIMGLYSAITVYVENWKG